jgi:hypothetical protein
MGFASKKPQSLADAARHAADTGLIAPKPRKSFLRRARWVSIPVAAASVLAASAVAINATRGSATQQTAVSSRPEPVTTGALIVSTSAVSAAPAKRASTPKKVAEIAKPEPARESAPWREPVDPKPAPPPEAAAPEPRPTPEPLRRQAELVRPKAADQPVASPARLVEMEPEAKERRLARIAKRKAVREARAAEAAAAERREKARAAEATAEERREKARSRAVAERRIARPEKVRSAAAVAPEPRVIQPRPRSTGVRVGLLTPFGVIGLSGGGQRYSMYPGAPPPRGGY